jgi:hypothetical protein
LRQPGHQLANNQLTNAGFASGALVDKLIIFYKPKNSSGAVP